MDLRGTLVQSKIKNLLAKAYGDVKPNKFGRELNVTLCHACRQMSVDGFTSFLGLRLRARVVEKEQCLHSLRENNQNKS